MKTIAKRLVITGALLWFCAPAAWSQGQDLEQAEQLLRETRDRIAGIESENESLREQLAEREVTIAEYNEMIEMLDQELEQLKEQLAALENNG